MLFAVSFVFLGIGTGISGSPLEAIGIGGADDPAEQFQDQIDEQEEKVQANPEDKAAMIELINLRYQAANQKYELDEETGATTLTPEAEEELERAADTWDQYLKAAGENPDSSAGLIAVQVFSALAQGQLQEAASGSGQAALDTADESLTNWANAGVAQLVVAAHGSPSSRPRRPSSSSSAETPPRPSRPHRKRSRLHRPARQKALQKRIDAAKQQGEQLNQQIEAYRKTLAKATQGAPGADTADEPLGDLGGGALGGGGGPSAAGAWPPRKRARPRRVRFYTAPPGPLAQLVEQETLNLKVAGSIPARPTFRPQAAAARLRINTDTPGAPGHYACRSKNVSWEGMLPQGLRRASAGLKSPSFRRSL